MQRQALILGLGQFGRALARSLTAHGVEVVAVDQRADRVQAVAPFVADALAFDAKDEEALRRLAPQRRDLCVCAIGDESREASIIVTALLRQMGAPHVVARATDELHARILKLVGAHEVVDPEAAFGARLAARLAYTGIIDEIPLGDDLVITELRAPASFVGQTLAELALPRRFAVTVVAIRRTEEGVGRLAMPDPRAPLRGDDVLVVVSSPGKVHLLTERV